MMLETSHPKKELFERCPEAYFHRYVNHYRELVSPELELGNIVRLALDNLYKEMNLRGQQIKSTAREVKSFAEDAITLLATPGHHSKSALAGLSPMVRFGLLGFNYEECIVISSKMGYEIPLTTEGHVLRGKINLFLARADGTVEAIAFKTGISVFEAQGDPLLATYALALREMGYAAERINCTVRFLANKKEDSTVFTDEYLDLLLEDYIEHVREVDASLEIGREAFPPTPSWYCDWCGYAGVCSIKTEEKQLVDSLEMGNLKELAKSVLVLESYLSRAKDILKKGTFKHGYVETNGEFFADWEGTTSSWNAEEVYRMLASFGEDPFAVLSVDKQKLKRVMNGSVGYALQDVAKTITTHSFGHRSERPPGKNVRAIEKIDVKQKEDISNDAA